jgi:predicted nucleotide-binding protein (sugar kinase/HSP70/actin superfamily)
MEMIPVVIFSRPYVVHDTQLSLGLIDHLINLGFFPIPLDLLPVEPEALSSPWGSLVWRYNQDYVRAIEFVKRHSRLYSILFTCYGCGPDAFFLDLFEDQLEGRPHLTLEFDEHIFTAGMITRCEAFRDLIEGRF